MITIYKITYGNNRGIEYASRVNPKIIAGLWGHPGTKVIDLGYDENGNEIYHLTDNQIKINPLLVACKLIEIKG